jgi:tetratricopeptide (TPR) repeat protein
MSSRVPATLALSMLALAALACGQPRATAVDQRSRGDQSLAAKRYGEAVAAYRDAVAANPRDGHLRLKLADALRLADDWAGWHQETILGADLLPGDRSAQLLGASSALATFRFDEAAARASRLLRDQPAQVAALIVLGNAHAHLPNSEWALYFLRTRLRRPDVLQSGLGEVRRPGTAKDDAEAERILRRALEVAPAAYETQLALVNFLWAVGRLDDAEPLLRSLADPRPGDLVLNHALAEYYLARGSSADGERFLVRAAASGDRDVRLRLAEFLQGAERDAEALTVLDGFTDDLPLGAVSLPRAAIECRQGNAEAGLRRIESILARVAAHGRALELKAECLYGSGKVGEALSVARMAVDTAPQSAQAHYLLGLALSSAGDVRGAYSELSEAVRLDPMHRPASRALARRAVEVGRPEVARQLAEAVMRTSPDDEEMAAIWVAALIGAREPATAAATLSRLLERFPTSAALLVQQGHLHVARGTKGARSAYERALEFDRDSREAVAGLVALDVAENRMPAARQRLETELGRHPDQPDYLLLLGEVFERDGDLAASEATYRRVLAINRRNLQGVMRLSSFLAGQRRFNEAIAVLHQAVAEAPGAADIRVRLAVMLERAGRAPEAREHYERVLAANPRAAEAAYRLALLHVDLGENLDVALSLATRAVEMLPDDPGANEALGWVYVRKNLPRIGLQHLEQCARVAPTNPTCQYRLGVAYMTMGQPRNGRARMARALALEPDFRFASEARAALSAVDR